MKNFFLDHINFISNPESFYVNRFANIIFICFVMLLTFTVGSIFAPIGVDSHHHGFMLQGAMSFVDGEMLYRDVYYHYGPLTAILHYFALRVWGMSILSLQIITVYAYALISMLLYLIWSRFLPKMLVLITCIFWLFLSPYFIRILLPWSSVFSLLFLLLTAYFLILYIEKHSSVYLFLCGTFVAFCFWSRQTVGILLFIVVFLFLIFFIFAMSEKKNGLFMFFLGIIFVSGAFSVWLILNGAFKPFFNHCFVGQLSMISGSSGNHGIFSYIFPIIKSLLPILSNQVDREQAINLWGIFPIVMLVLFVEVSYFLFLKRAVLRKPSSNQVYILFSFILICIASWAQYYPVTDIRHVYWAATPFLGVVTYFFWSTTVFLHKYLHLKRQKTVKWGFSFILFVFSVVLLSNISFRITNALTRHSVYSEKVSTPAILSGMKCSLSQKKAFQAISNSIQSAETKNSAVILKSVNDFLGKKNSWSPILYPFFTQNRLGLNVSQQLNTTILLYSSQEKSVEKYQEILHVTFDPPLFLNHQKFYLYAPY